MKDGVLLINKPCGTTSFSVVSQIRNRIGKIKCGHSGTLDPMAVGLLPVMLGKATKLSNYITSTNKYYRCKMKFGIFTDSYDTTGNIMKVEKSVVSEKDILSVLPKFVGEIEQKPPMYSAIKIGGVPLYKYARNNNVVDVPDRIIKINSIRYLGFNEITNELTLDIDCSKGTYIRSLCVDIAKSLNTIAAMSFLERYQCGKFILSDSISLFSALQYIDRKIIDKYIIGMDDVLSYYPLYEVNDFQAKLLVNGCEIDIKKLKGLPKGMCRVSCNGLLGLGEIITKEDDGGQYFKLAVHLN